MNPQSILSRGVRCNRGQTFLLFVFFMVVLIAFMGLGIDIGFAYLTKARLSKGVDAGCLRGIKSLSLGNAQAEAIAKATFRANYGDPGWDIGTPNVNAIVSLDAANNIILNMDASVPTRTYFLRTLGAIPGLPRWDSLNVGVSAEGLRPKLIMSLVLDRSGSMNNNGGADNLPGAVSSFVDFFDDNYDRVSMNSFAMHGRTDVVMTRPFKAAIKTAVNTMSFSGWTATEQGLLRGYQQIQAIPVLPGEKVIKVVILFTDGLANTFRENFRCGAVTNSLNITPDQRLFDPTTGAEVTSSCTVPASVPSISNPPGTVFTGTSCGDTGMYTEGGRRAEAMANTIRSDAGANDVIIYSIGLGDNPPFEECNIASPAMDFLGRVANVSGSTTYNPDQQQGLALLSTAENLQAAFDTIAANILARLSR